jgi:hypothetical protein
MAPRRNVLGLGARLTKLRAMSTGEISARIRYRLFTTIERRQHAKHQLTPAQRLREALRPEIRTSGTWQSQLLTSRRAQLTRFFPSVSQQAALGRLFETTYANQRASTLAHAADARAHRFEFFGRTFSYGMDVSWQADPVSGREWPAVYHLDVPVHGGDVGYGDVKYVWELSRQQYVIDLAKAWFLAGRREDLLAVQELVRSWIAGNPYATGVNWSCALEPAFRLFSWLWAYYLTMPDLDPDFHVEWLEGFYDHARFIERHLEHYSSPYNHLIAEGAALYMAGALFPEFRDATRWRERGRAVLEGRLAEQFYADGGSVEQSAWYHHATVGYYLLAGLTARATGDDLSPAVWSAVERGIEFSMAMSQPDGTTPAIGGADDGMPLRMEHLPLWDFRPYQAIGAVLFHRADFKAIAGRFQEDALWLLGVDGLDGFQALETAPPAKASMSLPSSGYYVMRSEWSANADYVCVDCGEQAAGLRHDSVPNSMHGHADCLSLIAWLRGRRVLVDSGLFAYNCGGVWEAHFRETAAHSTATVDGRDQALHLGKMAWSNSYRAVPEGWHGEPAQAWFVGSHDGYSRGDHGVVHRRAVWWRSAGYFVVYDEFVGSGQHDLALHYQFAAGEIVQLDDQTALFDDFAEIRWVSNQSWRVATRRGGSNPGEGWIAPSLGVRQAAPHLTLSCTSAASRTAVLTVIAARAGAEQVRTVSLGTQAGVVRVAGDGFADVIAVPALGLVDAIQTDGLLAVVRVHPDGRWEADRLGGTHVTVDPNALSALLPNTSDFMVRR